MFRAAVAIAVLLLPGNAAAEWMTLRSPNFVYVGDASERDIRDVARRLEQFREVMLRALPKAAATPRVPIVVVVFRNSGAFRPYMPVRDGKVVDVGGYFLSGPDVNYIGLTIGGADPYSAIFHEYAHFLNRNTVGDLPLWVNEGLAGIYETFEVYGGGRGALIGKVAQADLNVLNSEPLLPLTQLNAVDHESPIYGGDRRRGLFYAQSWALTHYLTIGNPARTPQFVDYLGRVDNGQASEAALRSAFGALALLERELSDYVRRFAFTAYRFEFDERITGAAAGPAEKLPDHEAQGYLGDLLARTDRREAAREYLQRILAARPEAARPAGVLGLIELRASNLDAGIALLERAVTGLPQDVSFRSALGRALHMRWRDTMMDDAVAATNRAAARQALLAAWELNASDAELAAMLGDVEDNSPAAVDWLKRAIALNPLRDHYRLMLASHLARVRDLAGATEQLGLVIARGRTPEVRTQARTMLGRVADMRIRLFGEPALAPNVADAVTLTPSPSAEAGSSAPAEARTAPPVAARRFEHLRVGSMTLTMRPLLSGETRTLGSFVEIACAPGRIVLVVDTDQGPKRLLTKELATVEFISYRPQPPASVTCGKQSPARVMATYRAAAAPGDVHGEAVAIELLPDGEIR